MFSDRYDKIQAIDGWLKDQMLVMLDSVLTYQRENGIGGNMIEIGVWKGRLASLLALHRGNGEQVLLVDPTNKPADVVASLQSVGASTEAVHSIPVYSQKLLGLPFWPKIIDTVRCIHIDGEHSRQAVMRDLAIAEQAVHDHGLVVLDDFMTVVYPQVTQAVFEYLLTNPGRFTLLACGFGKAFLCRPKTYRFYQDWIVDKLPSILNAHGHEITVVKSSSISDTPCYGIVSNNDLKKPADGSALPLYRGTDWDNRKNFETIVAKI
jgi:hypothetical protein